VLFGAIFLTYRVVWQGDGLASDCVLAALLASLGWIGASRGFALAVPVLWRATQLYGTLGSVVLFLIWAYVMAWVSMLGGFLLMPAGPRETDAGLGLVRDRHEFGAHILLSARSRTHARSRFIDCRAALRPSRARRPRSETGKLVVEPIRPTRTYAVIFFCWR
jgi:hypothetical protein